MAIRPSTNNNSGFPNQWQQTPALATSPAFVARPIPANMSNEEWTHERNAEVAFRNSEGLGKRFITCKSFKENVENPAINNDNLLNPLYDRERGIEPSILNSIFSALARKLNISEESARTNVRHFLRTQDYDGKTLIDQTADYYSAQREIQISIGSLHSIASLLLKAKREPSLRNQLLAQARESFKGLPDRAKGMLCETIWRLDGARNIPDYGYYRILENIEILLDHQHTNPIQTALNQYSRLNSQYNLTIAYIYPQEIPQKYTEETFRETTRVYQLQAFRNFLNDPYKDNAFLVKKFRELDPQLKELFSHLVWIAFYGPTQLGFGTNQIEADVRLLTRMRNPQGIDVISQLLTHYRERLKCEQLIVEKKEMKAARDHELGEFILNFNRPGANRLGLILGLNPAIRGALSFLIWDLHRRPQGDPNYGENKIKENPLCIFSGTPSLMNRYQRDLDETSTREIRELEQKMAQAQNTLTSAYATSKFIPEAPFDTSTDVLRRQSGLIDQLPPNLRVAMVTAELSGVVSLGGLAGAVDGMARALPKTRVILPKYLGPIPHSVLAQCKEKPEYRISTCGRTIRVYKVNIRGIRCYLIDIPDLLTIPNNPDGTTGNFYNGDYHHVKQRWAVFQSAAADLVVSFSKKENPVQLVQCHDSQVGLVPELIATRYPDEFRQGKTPVTVFTYHNNMEPCSYTDERCQELMKEIGLGKRDTNSFIEALWRADVVTTVSPQFGIESQTPLFGRGMERAVRIAASRGKLFGITNGRTGGLDPRNHKDLEKWSSNGIPKDLRLKIKSFQNLTPLEYKEFSKALKEIRKEFCDYLRRNKLADLDPEKPIVLNFGRFDSTQKGIGHLPEIMDEVLKAGAQFVCIGLEPDEKAKATLAQMQAMTKGRKGVLILEDKKENGVLRYQGVFGRLMRLMPDLAIFPSEFEPCGLVQGEMHGDGIPVIATDTGGFRNTIATEGPRFNGYLFKRCQKWNSPEQVAEIRKTVREALQKEAPYFARSRSNDLATQMPYLERRLGIMHRAQQETWESTSDPSDLSPIRRLELAYAKGFEKRKTRDVIPTDLRTLQV